MNNCPLNKTDSWKCPWKYIFATTQMCTRFNNQPCSVPCSFGQWETVGTYDNFIVEYDHIENLYKISYLTNGKVTDSCVFEGQEQLER